MFRDPLIDLMRRRVWAGWIDVLVLFIVGVLLAFAAGTAHIGHWTTNDDGFLTDHSGFSVSLNGAAFFLWVAIALLYYFLCELETGKTIGKRVMGLKVTTVSGQPPGVRAVFLRTLVRIIDVLPAFYLVGWIAMHGPLRPPQRLGDRLAGTTSFPLLIPELNPHQHVRGRATDRRLPPPEHSAARSGRSRSSRVAASRREPP